MMATAGIIESGMLMAVGPELPRNIVCIGWVT